MATVKTMKLGPLVAFSCALIVGCSLVFGQYKKVEATIIGYPAVEKGRASGCSIRHPDQCYPIPANPYSRGCEPENRCRGPPAASPASPASSPLDNYSNYHEKSKTNLFPKS
ncbi:hypothetical protein HN51_019588 [Arachis hypogaea]|nr:Protein RALF-like [Arachis hypogaea]